MKGNHNHQDYQDEEIIRLLKSMPKVEDDTDKNTLYKRISFKNNREEPKMKNRKKLLPIIGTIAAAAIILIFVVPMFMSNSPSETAQYDSSEETGTSTTASEEEGQSENEQENGEQERETETDGNNTQEEPAVNETDSAAEDTQQESQETETANETNEPAASGADSQTVPAGSNLNIVHAAVPDAQMQYVIPVSFIVPDSMDRDSAYNSMDDYLMNAGLTDENYLLNDVTYTFQGNQVELDLPDDFSLGQGSAQANIFQQILETMFSPLGIETVTFSEEVDMGPFGPLSQMELNTNNQASYKLYNGEYLGEVPQGEQTAISDAINEMKNGEEAFNMQATIPAGVDFSVESADNVLTLNASGSTAVGDTQEMTTMIDAILMTAKSYGYDEVVFENLSADQIGPYQVTESIQVPEAGNPIDVRN